MKWWIIALAILIVLVILGRPKIGRDILTTTITGPLTLSQARAALPRAARKAGTYWNGTRCLNINYEYRDLEKNRIAEARWYVSRIAPKVYFRCSITFDIQRIHTSFALFCAAVVHEFGHLDGFHEHNGPDNGFHSSNPRSIMYPQLTPLNIPATCRRG